MIKTTVIIVGSGFAGMMLSRLLKQKNIPFVVLDRIEKQKHIALAETLPPSAMPLLERLNVLELFEATAIKKTYGYHAVWGSASLQTAHFFNNNPFKFGLKINKEVVVNTLKSEAKDKVISYDSLEALAINDEGVSVVLQTKNKSQTIQGDFIIDATGRKRAILKRLGVAERTYDELLAYTTHVPKVTQTSLIHEVFTETFEHGWATVSSLNETTNVMTLFTNKMIKNGAQFKTFEAWKTLLKDTQYLSAFLPENNTAKIIGGKANSSTPKDIAGHRWLAIGDAALAFDPLSSHGITNALYTANYASEVIASTRLEGKGYLPKYHEDLTAIFNGYLKTKNHMYLMEKRWKTAPFWQVFHQ